MYTLIRLGETSAYFALQDPNDLSEILTVLFFYVLMSTKVEMTFEKLEIDCFYLYLCQL